MSKISDFKDKLLDLIYPSGIKCLFCGRELHDGVQFSTCDECFKDLPFIVDACPKCGSRKLFNYLGVCGKCKRNNFVFKQAQSTFEYQGKPLELVHRLKYNEAGYLVNPMIEFMIHKFRDSVVSADIVTSVPMFESKRKARGYNQSELLARKVAELTNIEYLDLCDKVVNTKSQTELNTKDRIKNVENSFTLKKEFKQTVKNKKILIVDDVITTGATVNELSKVFLKAGAKECYALSFAHTTLRE